MSQKISLEAHATCSPMTAMAFLPVRTGSDVVPESSSVLKCLKLWNPSRWSKDDLSRFAVFAMFLAQLIFWLNDQSP